MDYREQIEWLRGFEIDHSPDGWPAIRMREISAMCDAIESLLAEKATLELEVVRLRSVMADVIKAHGYTGGTPIEVMSTPFAPTALPELIEKVERKTIEQCRVELKRLDYWYSADAILRLPTGQIKLEELL